MELYSSDYSEDYWGWDETLLPEPGFGFLPPAVILNLNTMAEEMIKEDTENMTDLDRSNFSASLLAEYKCNILSEIWRDYYPHLAAEPTVCAPEWDDASCVPPSPAGSTAVWPCMQIFPNNLFDTRNASRECLEGGEWANLSDYSQCQVNTGDLKLGNQISSSAYLIGYTISFFALSISLIIYLWFKEMRCLRHKIHMGLFFTLLMTDILWIIIAFLQTLLVGDNYEVVLNILCVTQVLLRYFHLTTFYWMFLEGLYLFLQVQIPLSLATVRYIHFTIIGWILPLLNITLWLILRMKEDHASDHSSLYKNMDAKVLKVLNACPLLNDSVIDTYYYMLPVFILMVINTFFLFWIMFIVIVKLRSRSAMDHDKRHWKAAKALVVIIPLLGFTYILTLVGPSKTETPTAYLIYEGVRAILLSIQGGVITLPYCFLNSEVHNVIHSHWNRWKMVQSVGRRPTMTSVLHSNSIFSQLEGNNAKMKIVTTKVDSLFLSVPMSSSKGSCSSSKSASFSDITSTKDFSTI